MNKRLIIFTLLIAACFSCKPDTAVVEKLAEAQSTIDELMIDNERLIAEQRAVFPRAAGALMHVVYFKLKPDLTEEERKTFIQELKKMTSIEEVQGFQVGRFANLGDLRAMSDLDVVMQMGFKSEADYQAYQAHPVHLNLKAAVPDYLAGPPVTYDFNLE